MAQTTRTHIDRIHAVMVAVTDYDRAIDFYVNKLGFEQRTDVPYGEGERWIEVAPPGADTVISLCKERDSFKAGVMTNIGFVSKDIDAAHADLKSRGVDVDPEVQRMGGPVPPLCWFRDQDRNTLMIVGA